MVLYNLNILHVQITSDIDTSIQRIQQAEPYILLTLGEGSFQFFIVAENQIFCESSSLVDAIKDMFATYFVFDIQYPKPTNPVLTFLQRFVLDIKDLQPIPASVTRLVSMMDNH